MVRDCFLIYTRGITGDHGDSLHPAHAVVDDIVHFGRTLHTYASGFHCIVFLKDTSQLHPLRRWGKMDDLGPYSLFLVVSYPIDIAVAGEDVAPMYTPRTKQFAMILGHTMKFAASV
jgi:hypothetical protein